MEEPLYYEIQKDKPKILSVFLVCVSGILVIYMAYGLIQQLVFKIPFGNHSIDDLSLCFVSGGIIAFMMLFTWLYFKASLEILITKETISYKYFPIHWRLRNIAVNDISAAYVRECSPIQEYGGWGVRKTFTNGSAVTMQGTSGLQIVKKNGKKIFIGTQKPMEIANVVLNMGLGNSI